MVKLPAEVVQEIARAEAIFLSIGEGAVATDADGVVERLNQAAATLLGFDEKELIGKSFREAVVATDAFGTPLTLAQRPMTLSLQANATIRQRSYYRRRDGSLLPVVITVSPIIFAGNVVGTVEVFRDISQDLEIEKTKSDFISIASHQLRTPATVVKTYLSMLLEGYGGPLNGKQTAYVRMAFDGNERQLHIVNDLLSTAAAEAGRLLLTFEQVNASTLIKEVVGEFIPVFEERGQNIHTRIARRVTLEADASYLKMVIENLISNAAKYTDRGGSITVTLRDEGESIAIKVADTGVGISLAERPKLFKKFSRLDNPLSGESEGSGIGLYLLKQIVDLHGGKVSLRSRKNRGTTFTVRLPKQTPAVKRELKNTIPGGR